MPGVELLQSTSASNRKNQPNASKQGGRTASRWDRALQDKHTARHLQELDKDNYHDVKVDIPRSLDSNARGKRKQSAGVKRLLASRKTFAMHLDEAGQAMAPYHQAAAKMSFRPVRHFCTICGYWGSYVCIKCRARYCSLVCQETHKETRCLKTYA